MEFVGVYDDLNPAQHTTLVSFEIHLAREKILTKTWKIVKEHHVGYILCFQIFIAYTGPLTTEYMMTSDTPCKDSDQP